MEMLPVAVQICSASEWKSGSLVPAWFELCRPHFLPAKQHQLLILHLASKKPAIAPPSHAQSFVITWRFCISSGHSPSVPDMGNFACVYGVKANRSAAYATSI